MSSSAGEHTPRSAGHALHGLLDQVRNSGQQTVLAGWAAVLNAEAGSATWAQRHAEVVGLFRTLMQQVMSRPAKEPTRSRALRYAPAWYRAVVWQTHWQSTGEPPGKIIEDVMLDHLDSIADILALSLPSTAPRPTDDAVARLREELEVWLDLLRETDDVPPSTRAEIAGQVQHVLWLLDNVDTFGHAPVIREARLVVGQVTESLATQDPDSNTAKRWRDRAAQLIVALTLATGVVTQTNQALEAVQETINVTSEIIRGGNGNAAQPDSVPALPGGPGSSLPDADSNSKG